ncbi:RNA-guided endonuclease IscB [Limnofasciculus baicalensis]|uniref:RNA-guided endonuclease IscB n=1 Tax=Limnofasciculus baicalensis BBK-W-15 TaxID=2699891 RepID=A0AAE3KMR3_9CYAN|nr:RNA-guided endonuclease IscB [Limnofasciculus baicalensis]MCP2729061.1 RNA-guided endonuclease IscB [Limnofasciculus baicalensis BBK-W-15]
MSNFIFVLDTNYQQLNPIPPGQARRLLKLRQAAIYRRYPFTIILKYKGSNPKIEPHQLKIDPGSKVSGLAIVQNDRVIWGAELTHRGEQIKHGLESRRAIRCHRRNRKTRYRQPRFLNRTRKTGWLPPSLESRVENMMTWVNRITRYVPITGISQELVKFDTQAMSNPEISGIEYQQGELAGYEIREYLLSKWGRKCAYCGAENLPLEIEHIQPKSKGGSNRVSNLTIACRQCNQAKGSSDVRDFLTQKPEVLSRILKQAKQPLKDAAAVNATRWTLFNRLKEIALPIESGTGGQTKYNRTRLELPKNHWLDAACVGLVPRMEILTSQPLLITAKGWGSRMMCTTNKYGFPIKHKTRCQTFFGFKTGDIVSATLPRGKFTGTHVGRLIVRASGVFEMISSRGKVSPVRHKYCKAIHRKDGYMYGFSTLVHAH